MAGMDTPQLAAGSSFCEAMRRHSLSLGESPGHKSEERGSHRMNGPLDPFACPERRLPPIADDCVHGCLEEGQGLRR